MSVYSQKEGVNMNIFPSNIFWCFKPFDKQQHPPHAGGAVCQAHQAEKQHGDEGRMDGPLHQQGHTGKETEVLHMTLLPQRTGEHEFLGVVLTAERMLSRVFDIGE